MHILTPTEARRDLRRSPALRRALRSHRYDPDVVAGLSAERIRETLQCIMVGAGVHAGMSVMAGKSGDPYISIFGEKPFELWVAGIEGTDYVLDGVTGRVAQWIGRYNGNVASQSTDSLQPSVTANWKNGRKAITSDGTQWLQCAALHATLSQPCFIWIVAELFNISGGTSNPIIDGVASDERMTVSTDSATPSNWAIGAGSFAIGLDADDNKNLLFATFAATENLRVNNSSVASGAAGSDSTTGLTMFANFSQSVITQAHIAKIGVLSGRDATSDERTKLFNHETSVYSTFGVA